MGGGVVVRRGRGFQGGENGSVLARMWLESEGGRGRRRVEGVGGVVAGGGLASGVGPVTGRGGRVGWGAGGWVGGR